MGRLFNEAGVPPGVVNIVTGAGETVGEALTGAAGVDLITMTGSVPTGRRIMQVAATHLTPISLELGGKAPFIVMPDADLDLAVRSAVTSRFMNCGQVCICNERTLVHEDVYQPFLEAFVEQARALRLGDPLAEDTDIGPKVSRPNSRRSRRWSAAAVRDGARVALGGKRPAIAADAGRQLVFGDRPHRRQPGHGDHAGRDFRSGRADRVRSVASKTPWR